MNRKAPVPALRDQKPTWANAAALAKKWQLNKLAERVDTTCSHELILHADPPYVAAQAARGDSPGS
jgi:DNA polymerase-1